MRLRLIALGCALTGSLGFLALPHGAARADSTVRTETSAVLATKTKPALTITSGATDYRYGATVRFTVTLGPTFADRRVTLYASPYGEAGKLIAAGNVNAKGKWYPTYVITRKTTFTVDFGGDAHNRPASAVRTLQAYAKVANAVTGYFKQTTSGGLRYAIFHGSATLVLHSTVTPSKHGECLEPETEQYNAGTGWGNDTGYGCDTLDSGGHDSAPFSLAQAVGDRYRIRGDYIRGTKDLANLSVDGGWLYLEVVK